MTGTTATHWSPPGQAHGRLQVGDCLPAQSPKPKSFVDDHPRTDSAKPQTRTGVARPPTVERLERNTPGAPCAHTSARPANGPKGPSARAVFRSLPLHNHGGCAPWSRKPLSFHVVMALAPWVCRAAFQANLACPQTTFPCTSLACIRNGPVELFTPPAHNVTQDGLIPSPLSCVQLCPAPPVGTHTSLRLPCQSDTPAFRPYTEGKSGPGSAWSYLRHSPRVQRLNHLPDTQAPATTPAAELLPRLALLFS